MQVYFSLQNIRSMFRANLAGNRNFLKRSSRNPSKHSKMTEERKWNFFVFLLLFVISSKVLTKKVKRLQKNLLLVCHFYLVDVNLEQKAIMYLIAKLDFGQHGLPKEENCVE